MEIYNEKVFDLLSKDLKTIKIFEAKNKSISFDNMQEDTVKNVDEVMSVISRGESNRTIAKTFANDKSSRSHTIFRMVIERKDELVVDEETAKNMSEFELKILKSKPVIRVGQLNLVDLAGSENAHKHEDSDRMREGKNINLSLLHLKEIIIKLSKGQK
jgi:centromeric protein E